MSTKSKVFVITDAQGEVVATHAPARGVDAKLEVHSGLYPLPGQTLHETEFDVPASFQSEKEIRDFHEQLRVHLARSRAQHLQRKS
jgi:hypothetical protein